MDALNSMCDVCDWGPLVLMAATFRGPDSRSVGCCIVNRGCCRGCQRDFTHEGIYAGVSSSRPLWRRVAARSMSSGTCGGGGGSSCSGSLARFAGGEEPSTRRVSRCTQCVPADPQRVCVGQRR
jgi:hypothetical protein